MKNKLNKGTYGYLDRLKAHEWKKAALFLSIPIIIFLVAWAINGTRNTVVTVMVIVGCLPGCNQVVHALLARETAFPSMKMYLPHMRKIIMWTVSCCLDGM